MENKLELCPKRKLEGLGVSRVLEFRAWDSGLRLEHQSLRTVCNLPVSEKQVMHGTLPKPYTLNQPKP